MVCRSAACTWSGKGRHGEGPARRRPGKGFIALTASTVTADDMRPSAAREGSSRDEIEGTSRCDRYEIEGRSRARTAHDARVGAARDDPRASGLGGLGHLP